jgi:hypothetical protein
MIKFKLASTLLILCLSVASGHAQALCTTDNFDKKLYAVEVSPITYMFTDEENEGGLGRADAGRMQFILGFNKQGILLANQLVWAYDIFEQYGTGVYLGSANKTLTKFKAKKSLRGCFVDFKMAGVSNLNGYSWSVAADGFASMASALYTGSDTPDYFVLDNAAVSYAGKAEWATVSFTRIK